MGLETVTDIDDLDISNPLGTDPRSQGDDHIRNIKKALKTDFPSITGAMTATQAELNVLDGVTAGTVTASKGVVVDATSKVDVWNVDNLTIDGNTLTANTGAINITPAAGSAIVLDATINVDAGVVTGATSVTSTTFVGALTGNADTATSATSATTAGTVTTATQASITTAANLVTVGALDSGSITSNFGAIDNGASAITTTGTITGGVVVADNININGNTIISTDTAGNINVTPDTTGDLILDGVKWPQADGTANQILITDGAAQTAWGSPVTTTALTTHGDILFRNASALARLGAGTNGQFLTSGGAGADVSWSTQAAADLSPVQTNIALLGFLRSTDHATSVLNMQNGFIDQFEDQTGVDDVNSVEATYDATDDFYSPPSGVTVPMVVFDGVNDWVSRGAAFGSDSNVGLISLWWKHNVDGAAENVLVNATTRLDLQFSSANKFTMQLYSTASALLWNWTTDTTYTAASGYHHIAISWRLDGTPVGHVYIDGAAPALTTTTSPTTGTVDVADTNFFVGGNGAAEWDGELGQVYFTTEYLDITNATNLAKLITTGGEPVDFGAAGATPTGTQPLLFLNNTLATWQNNLGSGGGMTENGALTAGTDVVKAAGNMTLISEPQVALTAPDSAHVALFNQEVDTLTINTDILAWVSRSKQTFTATNATNVLNASAHGLVDTDRVMVISSAADLPLGLDSETVYYIVTAAAGTFQVSLTSGGPAVTFSDDGIGTHSVLAVSQCTLVDQGDFDTGKATLSGTVDISGQPSDTDMTLIVQTKNVKDTKLHGQSLQY